MCNHDVIERLEGVSVVAIDFGQATKRRIGEHDIESTVKLIREWLRSIKPVYCPEALGL
jgi:hypothetical protein